MPTYVMLMKLTAAGGAKLEESPLRIEVAKRAFEELGGEVRSFHVTMGEYDFVAVGDAPNDLCAMAFAAVMTKLGFVSVTTLKAFSEDDWAFAIDGKPEDLMTGTVPPMITPKAGRKPGFNIDELIKRLQAEA
jgi:uncharacterized protein with GYD domain